MLDKREALQGSTNKEPALSQKELAPKVGDLFNGWRQALTASDKFKENLAQRYLSGEAHMRDYEPEGRQRLRVILDDDTESRWVRYSIGDEGDSLMEVLEVLVLGKDYVLQKGKKKLELIRPWKTYPGNRGEGRNYISYEHSLVEGKPGIKETNTQAALDYGQKLLNDFQSPLSS